MEKLSVLLADDHAIIRDGLRQILADTEDLAVVGEAANGLEVMQKVRERDWNVLVLDISMPGRNGLELISTLVTANVVGEASRIGFGSALATIMLLISSVFIVIYLRIVMKEDR